jgi:eukaryotic-like serine/threonine-protein kinase
VRYCSRCHDTYEQDERFCPRDGGAVLEGKPTEDDPLVGQTLAGRYLVMNPVGRGGMGVVYEGEHIGLGKRCAIKLLLDTYGQDREVLTRFHQEARTASRIGHENIIDIMDIGDHNGRSFIVMEFLEGTDLRRVTKDGIMAVPRALAIFRQICRALSAAHKKDIIHRDMKPENVFLTERGGRADFVKLMDFGISKIKQARDAEVRLTQTGVVIGTPLYMAPEQGMGQSDIDHRVDIYAVGVMLFEALCGQTPFTANSYLGLITQHVHEEPPRPRDLNPDIPEDIEQVILCALNKRREDRFSSADEMAMALGASVLMPAASMSVAMPAVSVAMSHVRPVATPARTKATPVPTPVPTPSPAMTSAQPAEQPRGKRTLIFVALGAALLGAGVPTALVLLGKQQTPVPVVQAPVLQQPPPPTVVQESSLELRTEPSGAKVFIDEQPRGVTPTTITGLTTGMHSLRLELDGYVAISQDKSVSGAVVESYTLTALPRVAEQQPAVKIAAESTVKAGKRPVHRPESKPTSTPVSTPASTPVSRPASTPATTPKPPDDDHKTSPYLEPKKNPY